MEETSGEVTCVTGNSGTGAGRSPAETCPAAAEQTGTTHKEGEGTGTEISY